jgi:hypothetical protein
MRANINPLIKSRYTWTDPAAETESIGLPADAQLSWFLHATLTSLSWHDKSCPLIGTTPSGQLHRDNKRSSTYRDFAKTRQPWHRRHLTIPPSRYHKYCSVPTHSASRTTSNLIHCDKTLFGRLSIYTATRKMPAESSCQRADKKLASHHELLTN